MLSSETRFEGGHEDRFFGSRAKMIWAQLESDANNVSRDDRQFAKFAREQQQRYRKFVESRGKRYRSCTFSKYEIREPQQSTVVAALQQYAEQPDSIDSGKNIILFGPSGTGKDHLLMATAWELNYASGVVPSWFNGVEVSKRWRDSVREWEDSHSSFDGELRTCEILYVSDPLPPSGVLSEFLQERWFELIDYRYRNQLPVWMTLNVVDGAEAEQRMGTPIVDRLRDGALALHCNWPSYRESVSL